MKDMQATTGLNGDRVVVVDDDSDFSALLRLRLERDGFEVELHETFQSFESCRCGEGEATAVVMDLNLGAQDGLQAAELLAARRFSGSLFFISGADDRVIGAACRHAAAIGVPVAASFRKPFPLADLSSAIRRAAGARTGGGDSVLRQAIASGDLQYYFQPIVDLRTGAVVGAEALARWPQPDGTVIGAGQFLPQLGQQRLWAEFTETLLSRVAASLAQWRATGLPVCPISINLDTSLATDPDFGPRAAALVEAAGIPSGLIHFEITEQTAMEDTARALRALTWLRIKGFELAIDDFGTGFSSLSVLHAMPFTTLKIDQSFVRQILTDRSARIIVKAIIDLAHNLDLVCVAEGVENASIAEALKDMGCDRGQGFAFGGAMATDRFAALLRPAGRPVEATA